MTKTVKNYPIFKTIISENCITNPKVCSNNDIKLELVGIKILPESYILEYHCVSANSRLINALAGVNINCIEKNIH